MRQQHARRCTRTATMALTNATLPYALEIANRGYEKAMVDNPTIARGMNVIKGKIVHRAVAESVGLPYTPI